MKTIYINKRGQIREQINTIDFDRQKVTIDEEHLIIGVRDYENNDVDPIYLDAMPLEHIAIKRPQIDILGLLQGTELHNAGERLISGNDSALTVKNSATTTKKDISLIYDSANGKYEIQGQKNSVYYLEYNGNTGFHIYNSGPTDERILNWKTKFYLVLWENWSESFSVYEVVGLNKEKRSYYDIFKSGELKIKNVSMYGDGNNVLEKQIGLLYAMKASIGLTEVQTKILADGTGGADVTLYPKMFMSGHVHVRVDSSAGVQKYLQEKQLGSNKIQFLDQLRHWKEFGGYPPKPPTNSLNR